MSFIQEPFSGNLSVSGAFFTGTLFSGTFRWELFGRKSSVHFYRTFFFEKIDKNSLIFRKIYDKFDKFDKNEKKYFTALVDYQSSEITTKLLIDNCDIYFEKLLIDNLDTYLKF
jgi:hypothetical protein